MPEFRIGNRKFEYRITKRRNQKTLRISLQEDGAVLVSMPARYPIGQVREALRENSAWLLAAIEKLESAKARKAAALARDGLQAMFLGDRYAITIRRTAMNYGVQWSEAGFEVEIPEGIDADDELQIIANLFNDWYTAKAMKHLPPRIRHYADIMGVEVRRVTIRNQKTRWGSCSGKGNLNFSIRLLMMPPEVIDHIIVHELAHLKELNHSPNFWAIVERYDPGCEEHRAWLRRHGRSLTFP